MFDKLLKIPIVDFNKEQVKIGDVYLFTYNLRRSYVPTLDFIRESIAKYCIEKTDKFEIEQSYQNENGQLVIQAKCIANPLPFIAVFSIFVAGSSILFFILGLQLDKVEKVISLPTAKIISYAGIGLVLLSGYKTLFK